MNAFPGVPGAQFQMSFERLIAKRKIQGLYLGGNQPVGPVIFRRFQSPARRRLDSWNEL